MKKEVIVISLGGSLIIPNEVDEVFLSRFRKIIIKNTRRYKFIIVCGGGSIARKYINALKKSGIGNDLQSFAGIAATRTNARFMSYFFRYNQHMGIPHQIETVRKDIQNRDIVFCGALEYKPNQTSDSTSAEIAKKFNSRFINLTDVPGLYNKNPKEHKDAKFIPAVSWKDFDKLANKMKFKPGQHFVLDQTASRIIKENRIPTYILGKDMAQLDNLLNNKKFKGTIISG
ncbi:MAG: UMP kinase [Nanoarchaeota archaeon]|mgnify:FL=1